MLMVIETTDCGIRKKLVYVNAQYTDFYGNSPKNDDLVKGKFGN